MYDASFRNKNKAIHLKVTFASRLPPLGTALCLSWDISCCSDRACCSHQCHIYIACSSSSVAMPLHLSYYKNTFSISTCNMLAFVLVL